MGSSDSTMRHSGKARCSPISKTRARVTRWQLARALVENQGDKDDDGGGRKGPTGELRVISTDIQTRPRGPGCGEPSWGDLVQLWVGFSLHELDGWFPTSFLPLLPPHTPATNPGQWDSLPKQKLVLVTKGSALVEYRLGREAHSLLPSWPPSPTFFSQGSSGTTERFG